uniref:Small ribosomal subunit protein uS10 domain-containing protein n=1 Tax=Monodelphis domestica TaxID=13616 RepID=A0A5F8G3P8_MONDO
MPIKTLTNHNQKNSLCECSKAWKWFQMRIHEHLIDLHSPEIAKQIISVSTEPGIKVQVIIADA